MVKRKIRYKMMKYHHNKSLHLTAIPLRSIASGELGRSRRLRRRSAV